MTPDRAWQIANMILDAHPDLIPRWLMKGALTDPGSSLR